MVTYNSFDDADALLERLDNKDLILPTKTNLKSERLNNIKESSQDTKFSWWGESRCGEAHYSYSWHPSESRESSESRGYSYRYTYGESRSGESNW